MMSMSSASGVSLQQTSQTINLLVCFVSSLSGPGPFTCFSRFGQYHDFRLMWTSPGVCRVGFIFISKIHQTWKCTKNWKNMTWQHARKFGLLKIKLETLLGMMTVAPGATDPALSRSSRAVRWLRRACGRQFCEVHPILFERGILVAWTWICFVQIKMDLANLPA